MNMIVKIDDSQIRRMKAAIEGTGRKLRKELAVACNATAARCKNIVAKNIGKELAISQKVIKTAVSVGRKANEANISTHVDVAKDGRINVGYFGARQTKTGVSYRVSKTAGRVSAPGAFVIRKYDGKVYKRKGKQRFPITGIYGPSPWGVHVKGKKSVVSAAETQVVLKGQVERRIRFLLLKQSGTI
jgi:hypothetical protein